MPTFTRKRNPKQMWCVLLYKPPTEAEPQEVYGSFDSYALALNYASSLSPGEFPSTRFTILPYTHL